MGACPRPQKQPPEPPSPLKFWDPQRSPEVPAGPGGALPAALSAIYRPLPPARGLAGSPRPLQGGSGRPELRKTPGEPRAAAPGARLRAPQRSGGANTEGCRHRECKQQLPPARLPLALRARRSPHARKGRRGHGSPAGSGRRPPAALTVPPPPPRAPPPPFCALFTPQLSREPSACAARGR